MGGLTGYLLQKQVERLPHVLLERLEGIARHVANQTPENSLVNSSRLMAREVRRLRVIAGYLLHQEEFTGPLGETIDTLDLSAKSIKVLIDNDFLLIGELVLWTEADLLRLPHSGPMCVGNIKDALAKRGLALSAT